jgi:hypothetical protein
MPAMPAHSRAGRLALLAASTLVTLLVAEAALRIAGVGYPNFYGPDALRGWSLLPGAAGRWTKEGDAPVAISSDGLRDREHAAGKPPGVYRIAILGDSCVEALQVPLDRTFGALLERELPACPAFRGRRIETLNFGVSGYGTAQELLTLKSRVWKYRPDLVLLAFYSGNDVRNNYRPLEQDPMRPYFVLDRGALRLDDSFRATEGYRLRRSLPARVLYAVWNRSRLLQLGKMGKSALDGYVGAWKARRVTTQPIEELGLDNAVYQPPADPAWKAAWAATEAMLREMDAEARRHGARFAVASLSTPIQVDPRIAKRQAFARELKVPDLFYPDRRLAAFGRAQGIPFLPLAPPLADYAARTGRYLHGFPNTKPGEGHWNAAGHQQAARLLAAWICAGMPG